MASKKGTSGNDSLFGTASADTLDGLLGADFLSGLNGNDTLKGGAGNDFLDGGAGADVMIGGSGNDGYVVDNSGDSVRELNAEGTDTVTSAITYTLPNFVERLSLSGTRSINASGNALNNTLNGNNGANILTGGLGADLMRGGRGNDVYRVDNAGDVVTEAAKAGTDRVESSVDFTLGSNLENLTLTGQNGIDGTGNSLANVITGNVGNNHLSGAGGRDTVLGGAGDDRIDYDPLDAREDGGSGTDTLAITGSAVSLDLSAVSNLASLERIDLGTSSNRLTVTPESIAELSQTGTLVVEGDASAQVFADVADGSVWHFAGEFDGYARYTNAGATLDVALAIDRSGIVTNRAPQATADSVVIDEDTSLLVSLSLTAALTSNDTDPDGDSLAITSFISGETAHGVLADNGNGTYTYTPELNYNGADSFNYVLSDGNGGTSFGTINITLTPVNDAPVAAAVGFTVIEGIPLVIGKDFVLGNATDVDGDALTLTAFGGPTHGSVQDNGNGTVTYTPDANYNGSDSFTYTVSDGQGGSAQADVTIVVTGGNAAPVLALGGGSLGFTPSSSLPQSYVDTVLRQPDGKLVLAGNAASNLVNQMVVTRLNADGSPDTQFGDSGTVVVATPDSTTSDITYSASLQADGKILVAGTSFNGVDEEMCIVRLNADGSTDPGFGIDGRVVLALASSNDIVSAMLVQDDGKILLAGYQQGPDGYDHAIIRLNPDGSPDSSFGVNGTVALSLSSGTDEARAIAIQPDGRIVVVGDAFNGVDSDHTVLRLNPDGSLDQSFGTNGSEIFQIGTGNDYPEAVSLLADGRILIGGNAISTLGNYDFSVVRLNPDGTFDPGFGDAGSVLLPVGSFNDIFSSMTPLPDGRILLAGSTNNGLDNDTAVVRITADGALDASFYTGGKAIVPQGSGNDAAFSVLALPGGDIVLGGNVVNGTNFDSNIVVLRSDGSSDRSFNKLASASITHDPGMPPVVLASTVNIFDADFAGSDSYPGSSLTIARQGGANPDDQFVATGGLAPLVEGAALTVDEIVIGTVQQNSAGRLVLAFNATASQDLITDALQQIAYDNANLLAPPHIDLLWTFEDGNTGGQGAGGSLSDSITITVETVNDVPVLFVGGGHNSLSGGAGTRAFINAIVVQPDDRIITVGGLDTLVSDTVTGHIGLFRSSANGLPDSTLNGTGHAAISLLPVGQEVATGVAVAADGRIVVTGTYRAFDQTGFTLARFAPDGSLLDSVVEPLFGNHYVNDLAIQQDGGVVLVGNMQPGGSPFEDFLVVRYDSTLRRDGSFGTGSFSTSGQIRIDVSGHGFEDRANSVLVQSDGAIVVAGTAQRASLDGFSPVDYDLAVVRLLGAGSSAGLPDPGFGIGGVVRVDMAGFDDAALDVIQQTDGKLVLAGVSNNGTNNDIALLRLNANGARDSGFGASGKVLVDLGGNETGYDVVEDASGRLLVLGTANNIGQEQVVLLRLNPDGTRDNTFSQDGLVRIDVSELGTPALALQSDGRIVVATTDFSGAAHLTRLNADGTIDSSFGDGSQHSVMFFTENDAPTVLDPSASISDPELDAKGSYGGATLTLEALHGNVRDTSVYFYGSGSLSTYIFGGSTIAVSGVTIGQVDENASGRLHITFNNAATPALVNTALKSFAFWNYNDAPPLSDVVRWTFSDGNTGAQGNATSGTIEGIATHETTVYFTAVNDAPQLTLGDNQKIIGLNGAEYASAIDIDHNGISLMAGFSGLGGNFDLAATYLDAGGFVAGGYANNGTQLIDLRPATSVFDDLIAGPTLFTTIEGQRTTGTLETVGDQDWIGVDLQPFVTYTFSLHGKDSGGGSLSDPYLAGLYNSNGLLIADTADDDSGNGFDAQFDFTPTFDNAGRVYVAAAGFGNSTGTYSLVVSSISDDYSEDLLTAGKVNVGGSVQGTSNNFSDHDWFAVNLDAGVSYAISVQGASSGLGTLENPRFNGVFDAAGFGLPGTADESPGVVFTPEFAGTYYLDAGGNGIGTYTLSVEKTGIDDLSANSLTTGSLANGVAQGVLETGGDEDWFRVNLEAGQNYQISVQATGTLANPTLLALHDANGVALSNTFDEDSGPGNDARLVFSPQQSGTYFVAAGSAANGAGSYSVSVVTLQDDFSSDLLTAGDLDGRGLSGGTALTGTINSNGDRDWIRAELDADSIYTFALKGFDSNAGTLANPEIEGLYDANGNPILGTADSDSGNGLDAEIRFAPQQAGIYYLSAKGSAGSLGTYTLQLSADDHADDVSTTGRLPVGGKVSAVFEKALDTDWFAVTLEANVRYVVSAEGVATGQGSAGSIQITGIFDAGGSYLGSYNYYGGYGGNALTTFMPSTSGTYYVGVLGYDSSPASYTVSALEVPAATVVHDAQGHSFVATNTIGPNPDFVIAGLDSAGGFYSSFNDSDVVRVDVGGLGLGDRIADLVLDPDGFLILGGTSATAGGDQDFSVVRLGSNGGLDPTFANDTSSAVRVDFGGTVDSLSQVLLQPDGKILLVGTATSDFNSNFAVARLNPDGSLDSSFGNGGTLVVEGSDFGSNEHATSALLDANGNILIAGAAGFELDLVRLLPDGSFDTSFDFDGRVALFSGNEFNVDTDLAIDNQGAILLAAVGDRGGYYTSTKLVVLSPVDGSIDYSRGFEASYSGFGDFRVGSVSVDASGDLAMTGAVTDYYFYEDKAQTTDASVIYLHADGSPDVRTGFSIGTAPKPMAGSASYFDPELGAVDNFAGSSIYIERHGGASPLDSFFGGTLIEGDLSEGSSFGIFGQTLGTVTLNSGGALALLFTSDATTSGAAGAVIRDLRYANLDPNATGSVRLDWTLNDGNTGAQGAGTTSHPYQEGKASTTLLFAEPHRVQGTNDPETLNGTVADDRLAGQQGDDTLFGDSGNDLLVGGAGDDALFGGAGDDVFHFGQNAVQNGAVDTIFDFEGAGVGGGDVIGLDQSYFSALPLGRVPENAFVNYDSTAFGGGRPDTGTSHLYYDRATGILSYDFDGAGTAPSETIAVIANFPFALIASDFLMTFG